MSLWAAIPVRGFASGKSRLATVLDDRTRAALNRRLFVQTVRCAAAVLGANRVLAVSPDDAVIAAADWRGLRGLREPPGAGLNGALVAARLDATKRGATALLTLSCDLPLLTSDDVAAACDAWRGLDSMLIATDDRGTGTNALIVGVDNPFDYAMGHGSAARHRAAARGAGLTVVAPAIPGIGFDLDTPADLANWRARGDDVRSPIDANFWVANTAGRAATGATLSNRLDQP